MSSVFRLYQPYVAATPVPEEAPADYQYPRFYKMAGGDGLMHDIDLEAEPDMELIDEVTRNPANNEYYLFTRRNSILSQTLVINNANSITRSNFNANNPTVVIAHGWLSTRLTEPNPTVRRAYVAATPVPEEAPADYQYPRFYKMAGGDGLMHDIDLEAEPDMELIDEVTRNPANNEYYLFTRRNSILSQTLVINNANSITRSNFNANNPTVVIAHGWLSTRLTEPNPTVRRAYLDKSDVNVIVVDWSRLARSDYATAALGVPAVGRGVGQFLRFLNQVTGARIDTMHLIGFSLGAHLVGNAGRELGGQVARVTGLDPAGPLWNYRTDRLGPNDGRYVEAIHTDGGVGGLGIGSAIANADFFPNGGNSQPGCLTSLCNHNRAWELFAATVARNHLVGQQCTSTLQITWNTCRGARFNMGNDDLNKFGTGMYRLDTGRRYPY